MKKLLFTLLSLGLFASVAHAADMPTFHLNAKDGVFTPSRIVVPANKRFMIEIHNVGRTAIEFESVELRKEKALSPGGSSFVVINSLDAGEYKFFDDFHPNTGKGVVVAK